MRKFEPGRHSGVMIIRLREPGKAAILERVRTAIANTALESWAKCLVVITDRKVRVRRPAST